MCKEIYPQVMVRDRSLWSLKEVRTLIIHFFFVDLFLTYLAFL